MAGVRGPPPRHLTCWAAIRGAPRGDEAADMSKDPGHDHANEQRRSRSLSWERSNVEHRPTGEGGRPPRRISRRRSSGYASCVVSDGATPDEAPSSVPTGGSTVARQPRRLRNVSLVVVAFVLALGAVAAGTVFFFYDRATAIDRSNPEVVASQFLRAALIQRDPSRVALFVCERWSAEEALAAVAPPTDASVSSSWGDYVTTVTGSTAELSVKVEFVLGGGVAASSVRTWHLDLEDQDGWRVCALTKDPPVAS